MHDNQGAFWNRRIEERPRLDIGPLMFYLFILLLILKLTGVITWGWWIITMPIWGLFMLFMTLILVATMLACIPEIWEHTAVRAASWLRRLTSWCQSVVSGCRGKK